MSKNYKRVLTIAGSDSGGGAGIQADLKTFSALGCYGTSAITAITAQNTLGVSLIHPVPVNVIRAQIITVLDDIGSNAIKIGMLHSTEVMRAVTEVLTLYPEIPIVLDPVMVATSGNVLLQPNAIKTLKEILIPNVMVMTPNIPEAEILLDRKINCRNELPAAAKDLAALGCSSVLIKSGHLNETVLVDYFYDTRTNQLMELPSKRLTTRNSHGTGCTLSSAVAAELAKGEPLNQAVRNAKNYLLTALAQGSNYKIGRGHGPVHHLYNHWD